jgi:hypothetical protein
MLKHIAKHDHLPDYRVVLTEENDMVTFYNRDSWGKYTPLPAGADALPALPEEAYEEGRAAAPGYDIYWLETEWRKFWAGSGKPKVENHAAAFVGFCRSRNKRAPIDRTPVNDWEEAPALDES